jgi:integrase
MLLHTFTRDIINGGTFMKGCRPLSESEVIIVNQSFSGRFAARDRALFILGLKSGLRISERLSLQVKDVYRYGHMLERVTVARQRMKGKHEGRTVLFHPDAQSAVADWLRVAPLDPDTYLFQSRQGGNKPMTCMQAWTVLKQAYDANQLTGKVACHPMRKTYACKIYEKVSQDLVKTQKLMSHKNVNSTVQYLSFAESELDEAVLAI